ncbi:MAG: LMBR1-like membrane protein-domain-containing protein [Monoraphidium minutum]|nr:MAG: LMBR1-like membrane protein-domain-containing protein [Monoraphidium minutum]
MWGFFSAALAALLVCIFILLKRYAAPSVPLVVEAATSYAWLVAFIVVVLVPIDVFTTLTARADTAALNVLWQVCFWSTQVLTWLLLPFFQVYADAGDFTVGERCMTSLKENGILYGAAGAAGVIGLIVIIVVEKSLRLTDLVALGMGLSNTFALSVGLLLMGYGLVEIPRETWKSGPEQLLKWCAHRTGRFAGEVLRATAELEAVVTIVVANERQMPRRDPLRPLMEVISQFAEAESPVKPSQVGARSLDIERLAADDLEYNYDVAGLAALRRRLAAAIHNYKGAHAQYEEVVRSALALQQVVKSRERGDYEAPPGAPGAGQPWGDALWRYRCVVHPHGRKLVGLLLGCLSLVIIWSEGTIFTGQHPDLSPFSLAIRGAVPHEVWVQLITAIPLAYICVCTYFALFRLNAFDFNKLLPRATTGAALMQNGSLMCRFAPATCWNFLHMIHMDGRVGSTKTVFTRNMGTMDVLPVLGQHLNVYLPLLLVVHCAVTYLRLWDRLTAKCVSSKYRFTSDDADDQYTERGRGLLRKEAEGAANGLAVGDILHSDVIDLEFPGLGPKKRERFLLVFETG